MTSPVSSPSCPPLVRLNVGGAVHEVSRSLIERHPDTYLSKLISEEWNGHVDKQLFIDADPEMFR